MSESDSGSSDKLLAISDEQMDVDETSSSSDDVTNSEVTSSKDQEEMMETNLIKVRKSASTNTKNSNKLPYNAAGRGVSIAVLIKDGILKPRKKCLSLEYLKKTFYGDLLPDGKIQSSTTEDIFNSPSAWAIHCKRLVNPAKKSGCGWASVKYNGVKLDEFKATWYKKKKLSCGIPVSEAESQIKMIRNEIMHDDSSNDRLSPPTSEVSSTQSSLPTLSPVSTPKGKRSARKINSENSNNKESKKKFASKIRYSQINNDTPADTLIECVHFSSIGKLQPFSVSISSNAMLIMDLHCHLTTSEVVGYIGGKWDPQTQFLRVLQAFPCRCRLGDNNISAVVQEEIQKSMKARDMILVGWYHSHPTSQPNPTVQDLSTQKQFQSVLRTDDSTQEPCLGLIISPFYTNRSHVDSGVCSYWVYSTNDSESVINGSKMPMHVHYTLSQDRFLTQDVLNEVKHLAAFYKGAPDYANFESSWHGSMTYIEKLKGSLAKKLPKDQGGSLLLEIIESILL
ncbi:MPN domain-containing protein [Trichoplax sp. H2]|nr:MPN domain-containing protein [Trichoplax sp. H2]|eukprot:RDD41015.1 MPN domain-containing protein [Trichoplax sp. H2]